MSQTVDCQRHLFGMTFFSLLKEPDYGLFPYFAGLLTVSCSRDFSVAVRVAKAGQFFCHLSRIGDRYAATDGSVPLSVHYPDGRML